MKRNQPSGLRLSLLIAARYLFSRKQKTVINIISWISLVGIAVSTMALIIVLSVYNGIGKLTQSLFNAFDPALLVEPAQGKTFHLGTIDFNALEAIPEVAAISQLAEENAMITYRHNQAIVQLRGVDQQYTQITGLDTLLYEGEYCLFDNLQAAVGESETDIDDEYIPAPNEYHYLLLGAEIYYQLGIRQASNTPAMVHIPKRGQGLGMTMEEAFNSGAAIPAGNFYIQQDIDNLYVVTDIEFVRQLMNYAPDECTSLAIALKPGASLKKAKQAVNQILNTETENHTHFTIKDRFEQQPIYYKVFRSERLGIYLILSLIVLISTFNLVASLSLLIVDKRKDINTLKHMGMPRRELRRIFRLEGIMISFVGIIAGMIIGFIICFIQQQFGIVKLGSNFVVSAYPVAMRGIDFLYTFLLVSILSIGAVMLAVRRAKL